MQLTIPEFAGMLVLAACLGGGGAAGLITLVEQKATPELLTDLSSEYAEADRQFAKRIARAFPAGSSEAALITTLERQGFVPDWRETADGERSAAFDFSSIVCVQKARVRWRTDAKGQIRTVRSRYGEEGCW